MRIAIICAIGLVAAFVASSTAVADPMDRAAMEAKLKKTLGQSAKDAVKTLGFDGAEWHWVDEPPCILRGVAYSKKHGSELILYIAQGQPLYRKFDESRAWDYNVFLKCRIGGIQYQSGDIVIDVGSAVPFQFRAPKR